MLTLRFFFDNKRYAFCLPDVEKWSEELEIGDAKVGCEGSVCFRIRCTEGVWSIYCPEGFAWMDDIPKIRSRKLGDKFNLIASDSRRNIGVMCSAFCREETIFRKYIFDAKRIAIGTDHTNDICINSPIISARNAIMYKGLDGGCTFTNGESKNGAYINGKYINEEEIQLKYGDVIDLLGAKIVYLDDVIAVSDAESVSVHLDTYYFSDASGSQATSEETESLVKFIHRSPVFQEEATGGEIRIDPPPVSADHQIQPPLWLIIGPSITMMLPMALSSVVLGMSGYRLPGMIMMGTSAILSAAWGLVSRFYHKGSTERQIKERKADYLHRLSYVESNLADISKKTREKLLDKYPDGRACLEMLLQGCGLWERMPIAEDFLRVRLGVGKVDAPFRISIPQLPMGIIEEADQRSARIDVYYDGYTQKEKEEREEFLTYMTAPMEMKRRYSVLDDVPITVDLSAYSVLGIGGGNGVWDVVKNIVSQFAVLNSYTEVRLAFISTREERETWKSLRWLPHAALGSSQTCHMIASGFEQGRELLNTLDEIWLRRMEGEEKDELPHYVLICTDAEILTMHPLFTHVSGRQLGFSIIISSEDASMLPKECQAVLDCTEKKLHDSLRKCSIDCIPDRVVEEKMMDCFRLMASCREKGLEMNMAIPDAVTLFEPYGVRSVADIGVMDNWGRYDTTAGIEAVLGIGKGAKPFVLNISDKYHGPHGIVAGTTGAGKSELLRTYILSLAMRYSPAQVQFVLIDYKGGGAFNDFSSLPHVVGSIDNLHGEKQVMRALWSIQGEINRREALFKQQNVSSIDEYNIQARKNGKVLSHLIVIIDEFAQLKDKIPNFMHDLIETARVGRSVGIHLILATQKPAGSIDDEIWSNSRFHICLRVQTKADSIDMLHRPDAAYIKGVGRCFVQVGNDELFEQVQTCWSGAEYDPTRMGADEMPHLLDRSGRVIRYGADRKQSEQTQMTALLEHMIALGRMSPEFAQEKLWKDELESVIAFEDAQRIQTEYPAKLLCPFALLDDVRNQRYITVCMDLFALRSLLIVGPSTAGKTTLLQTMVYSLSKYYTADQVQIYILSLDSHSLSSLSTIPHVRDILFSNDVDECVRFVLFAEQMVAARKAVLNAAGTDNFISYHLSDLDGTEQMPAVVVMIDRLCQWLETLDEAMQDKCIDLIRSAAGYGVFFVATALERSEVPVKLRETFAYIGLNLKNSSDYLDCGIRVQPEMITGGLCAGRGIYNWEGSAFEMQVLLPFGEKNDSARRDRLFDYGKKIAPAKTPLPLVPRIPDELNWRHMDALCKNGVCPPLYFPIAYSKNTGKPVMLDMEKSFAGGILGMKKTGKTTFLRAVCESVLAAGGKAYVIGRESDWGDFAGRENVCFAPLRASMIHHLLAELETEIKLRAPRKSDAMKAGTSALRLLASSFAPLCLLMDDMELWFEEKDGTEDRLYIDGVSRSRVHTFLNKGVYYNLLIFGCFGVNEYGKLMLNNEVTEKMISSGAGIALRDTILECNPWNIAIKNRRSLGNKKIGEGYIVIGDTLDPIVCPKA